MREPKFIIGMGAVALSAAAAAAHTGYRTASYNNFPQRKGENAASLKLRKMKRAKVRLK